ncbi:MAG: helix-hairpin-helix domain-containing protein, partial [Thermodesulfovibrionales bacterium]
MGKKKPEEMDKLKEKFISGACQNGIPADKAERIFDRMANFAEYGFNKSHSAAYAFVAYQTAYLKANFPVEFMAANLSADMDNTEKVVKFINECRAMGIEVLPPDINLSEREFMVLGHSVRFGLEAVKGVGSAAIESVLEARVTAQFASLEDFMSRVDSRRVNKKVVEKLIKAGAFDALVPSRKCAVTELEKSGGRATSYSLFGQQNVLAEDDASGARPSDEWDKNEQLAFEKEALGFYITGHPLSKFKNYLQCLRTRKTKYFSHPERLKGGEEVLVAGIVGAIRRSQTKSRQESMAMFVLEDEEGFVDVIVFPDVYRKYEAMLIKDSSILLKGSVEVTEKGT